jgi:hypothetical protein
MRRMLYGVLAVALFGLSIPNSAYGQQAWGSLSGKVTLNGNPPDVANLVPQMMKHADKDCCLDPKAKPEEKVDRTWVVDGKTKGVKNVFVYLMMSEGKEYPIHPDLLKRKETITIDQPHCVFIPRVQAFQPYHMIDGKEVPTGQKMIIKNSASVNHNIRALGGNGIGFNINLPPGEQTNITKKLPAYKLPYTLNCDVHPWMAGKLFVFDHPYYTMTKADGTFEMPIVPAGAEVTIMAWHEGVGYVLTNKGKTMKIAPGKNAFDFQVVP